MRRFIIMFGIALAWVPVLQAQTDADCLACHADASMSMQRKGKTIALTVDGKAFSLSAHAGIGCISCHEGFNPTELPHAAKIKPVNCLSCHESDALKDYGKSIHGSSTKDKAAAARCVDCHTTHAIRPLANLDALQKKSFAEGVCSKCHGQVSVRYVQSDHGLALARGVKGAPTCIDCHGEHGVHASSDTVSVTNRIHQARMCESCHLDKADVRSRVGPSAGFIRSYEESVHGQAIKHGNDAAATCTDCHTSHDMKKGSNPSSTVAKRNIASTCAQCHGDKKEEYEASIHGKALINGISASPTCTDCHGEHNILSPKDSRSPVAAANVSSQVCSPCHASVRLTQKYGLAADRFRSFEDSFHGLANRAGSVEVANCASCHGVHDIKPSSDSTSRISPNNLARTCGDCHKGANANFTRGSVHVIATESTNDVLYFVSNGYVSLIILIIGGMLAHNILDFIKKSRRQLMYRRGDLPRKHAPHRLYVRMSFSERIQHASLLTSFITLVLTGFALRYPEAWWVAPFRSISPWAFELRGIFHRLAAVVLVSASLYHIYYLMFVPRGKQLLRDLLPGGRILMMWPPSSNTISGSPKRNPSSAGSATLKRANTGH